VAQSAELPNRGEIRWALVPHAAQAPFSIDGAASGLDFATASAWIRSRGPREAARLILPAGERPVLLLHGWESAHHGAFGVLRTRRVSALSPAVREVLHAGTTDDLVLLRGTSAGHQRVAMLAGLTRVHGTAIDSAVVGRVDDATTRRCAAWAKGLPRASPSISIASSSNASRPRSPSS